MKYIHFKMRKLPAVFKYFNILIFLIFYYMHLVASGQVHVDSGAGLKNETFGNDIPEIYEFAEPSAHYRLKPLTELDFKVRETSGLAYINGTLWTHNDSNHENHIYQIDTISGEVLRRVVIKNSVNHDWEDMAQDDEFLYIGDFGNNTGSRENLHILKIKIVDFLYSENDTVDAEFIHFHYPDQTDFSSRHNNNDFDCEAFFWYNDFLHLFTKNWVDNKTRHYVLPATPGTYEAEYKSTFNVCGMVTGADINKLNEVLILGYDTDWNSFLWLCRDFDNSDFFGRNTKRIELGSSLIVGQTEGLVFVNGRYGYISSELVQQLFVNIPQRLYSFNGNDFLSDTLTDFHIQGTHVSKIKIFPNPATDVIFVEIHLPQCSMAQITIIDELQKPVYMKSHSMMHYSKNIVSIPIQRFSSGLYMINIEFCNQVTEHKLVIQGT